MHRAFEAPHGAWSLANAREAPSPCQWYNPPVESKSWRSALERTRRSAFGRIATLLGASELSPAFWDELEAHLIQADLGVDATQALIAALQSQANAEGWLTGAQVRGGLRALLLEQLQTAPEIGFEHPPAVVILAGVNGSGKTTTAAKLAWRWSQAGRKVLLAAADTYRAAAREQLEIWGRRLGLDVIAGQPGGDPGAVAYDACQAGRARRLDAVLIDTSGRMHTEANLMAELAKIVRVAERQSDGAAPHVLLVLDATTGQNGIQQARAFAEAVRVESVVLAKLDGSAKGGVGFAVSRTLGLPIAYVGLGEGLEDLAPFDPQGFVDGLLAEEER